MSFQRLQLSGGAVRRSQVQRLLLPVNTALFILSVFDPFRGGLWEATRATWWANSAQEARKTPKGEIPPGFGPKNLLTKTPEKKSKKKWDSGQKY